MLAPGVRTTKELAVGSSDDTEVAVRIRTTKELAVGSSDAAEVAAEFRPRDRVTVSPLRPAAASRSQLQKRKGRRLRSAFPYSPDEELSNHEGQVQRDYF